MAGDDIQVFSVEAVLQPPVRKCRGWGFMELQGNLRVIG